MNTQVVIAGLVGAAAAADCADAFTKSSEQMIRALEEQRADYENMLPQLEEAAALEAELVQEIQEKYDTAESIAAPFLASVGEYSTDIAELNGLRGGKVGEISNFGATNQEATPLGEAQAALDAAEGLMNTAQGKYNDQVAANSQLADAVTEHNAEVITLKLALEASEAAEVTAISNYEAAEAVKQAFVDERAVPSTGQAAVLVSKTSDYSTALGDFEGAGAYFLTESPIVKSAAYTNWLAAKKAYDSKVKEIALLAEGCIFTEDYNSDSDTDDAGESLNCSTQTSDQVGVIYNAATPDVVDPSGSLFAANTAEEAIWPPLVIATANFQAAMKKALFWKEVATTNDTAVATLATDEDSVIADRLADKNTATENKETAETDLETAETQEGNAQTDLARGETILAALLADLDMTKGDFIRREYDLSLMQAAKTVIQEQVDAEDALRVDWGVLQEMAEETADRAQLAVDFYLTRLREANDSNNLAQGMYFSLNETNEQNNRDLEAETENLALLIDGCKGERYEKAQDALRAKLDRDASDEAAIATVKADYDVASAVPADGSANSLCNYAVRTSLDEDRGERPPCNEGLCCGAAQKFMQDGTKLAIETCQLLGANAYKYYPPLPARAVVAPAVETWRFQCISGAQKLVAAATAALAASYMMA